MVRANRSRPERLGEILSGQGKLPFGAAEAETAGEQLPPGAPSLVKSVGSLEGVDFALRELGWLQSRRKQMAAALDARIDADRARTAAAMAVTVGGKAVPFAEREAWLEKEIELFCRKNRGHLLEEGKKSRELRHGTFGWKRSRPGLVPTNRKEPAGSIALLDKLLGLAAACLAKAPGILGRWARFCEFKPVLSKTRLLDAFEAEEIGHDKLIAAGYRYQAAREQFFADPKGNELSQPQ